MRMTTLLKKLLGIQHLLVTGFAVEEGALVMEVRPSWRRPRCSGCEQRRGRYDTLAPRRWRHLDFGDEIPKRLLAVVKPSSIDHGHQDKYRQQHSFWPD